MTQENTIKLEQKTVYGRELFYPVDAFGKAFLALKGPETKTFVESDLDAFRAAGFTVQVSHG